MGAVVLLSVFFDVWQVGLWFGFPLSNPFHWTNNQWWLFNFAWKKTIIWDFIFLIIGFLFIKIRYRVLFPIMLVYLIFMALPNTLKSMNTIPNNPLTTLYLVPQVENTLTLIQLFLSIIGTILWWRQIHNRRQSSASKQPGDKA